MSWSVTVNDLQDVTGMPDDIYQRLMTDNPRYADDARWALTVAQATGLVSATLSGGRTPSPYGGPDTVVISVVGFSDDRVGHAVAPQEFIPEMLRTILFDEMTWPEVRTDEACRLYPDMRADGKGYRDCPGCREVCARLGVPLPEDDDAEDGPEDLRVPGAAGGAGGGVGGDPEAPGAEPGADGAAPPGAVPD